MAVGPSAGGATMVLLTAKASSRTSSAATLSSWARAVILEASPAILRPLPSTSSRSATSLSRLSARSANSSWFISVSSFSVSLGFCYENPLLCLALLAAALRRALARPAGRRRALFGRRCLRRACWPKSPHWGGFHVRFYALGRIGGFGHGPRAG